VVHFPPTFFTIVSVPSPFELNARPVPRVIFRGVTSCADSGRCESPKSSYIGNGHLVIANREQYTVLGIHGKTGRFHTG
jgi:hypothetical protein